jgi:hypothetical protein
MINSDSTTWTSELLEAVRGKLQNAPAPLRLAEVVKGLRRPRKTKAADFQNEIRPILDEQVRLGLAFRCPSGKNGESRYWSRDERHLLREKALEFASTPQTMAAIKAKLKREAKGVDAAFVQSLIGELIEEKKLFEHPPKNARSGSLIAVTPSPPPLAQPRHAKALNKLVADCRKLLASSKVSVEELLQTVQAQLRSSADAGANNFIAETATTHPQRTTTAAQPPRAELDEVILKALEHAPVLSLAELRASMPVEYRGSSFDEGVLRLADEQQVILSQDAIPAHFSEAEKAGYVSDGEALFTTIAKWS